MTLPTLREALQQLLREGLLQAPRAWQESLAARLGGGCGGLHRLVSTT